MWKGFLLFLPKSGERGKLPPLPFQFRRLWDVIFCTLTHLRSVPNWRNLRHFALPDIWPGCYIQGFWCWIWWKLNPILTAEYRNASDIYVMICQSVWVSPSVRSVRPFFCLFYFLTNLPSSYIYFESKYRYRLLGPRGRRLVLKLTDLIVERETEKYKSKLNLRLKYTGRTKFMRK